MKAVASNVPKLGRKQKIAIFAKKFATKNFAIMRNNPFKFGSIVDGRFFTDREKEANHVKSILDSENHLIIMSPRRYGKSSLINKTTNEITRPVVLLDLQLVTDTNDMAAQLLKRIYRLFPFERLRQYIQNFRIIPTVSINPVTNAVDISFHPESNPMPILEDVLNLLEKLSTPQRKIIVVFDEFQEVVNFDKKILSHLRSVMQYHKNLNYIFLGSQESMIYEIFEKKKSPFYHFGLVLRLKKIPEKDFRNFLNEGFSYLTSNTAKITDEILAITDCHPYYTQQLAFMAWEELQKTQDEANCVQSALSILIEMHDIDYERLWNNLNKTDQKLLIGLAHMPQSPTSEVFIRKYNLGATSTAYSSLKRMMKQGYIIKTQKEAELDDPFFRLWINHRREA